MSLRGLPLFFALPVLAFLASACGEGGSSARDAEATTEYPREVLQAHMKDHFFKATEMQVAVINGDLEAVQEPARWMAEHANSAAMPAQWEPHAEAMHDWALQAAEAPDIETAARATAGMGAECGACHRDLGAEVVFAEPEPLPEGEGSAVHMARHAWASGRMWEGLVAPSGVAWDEGAGVLSEAPLAPAEIPAEIDVLAEVSEMEALVHELGAESVGLTGQAARARVYGEFLATCAVCHEKTGQGGI